MGEIFWLFVLLFIVGGALYFLSRVNWNYGMPLTDTSDEVSVGEVNSVAIPPLTKEELEEERKIANEFITEVSVAARIAMERKKDEDIKKLCQTEHWKKQ